MRSEQYNFEQIDHGIKTLMRKTKLLKKYSMLMLLGTAANIMFTVCFLVIYRSYHDFMLIVVATMFFIVLISAFHFDTLRRDGNTLFETISDELHASNTKVIDNKYTFENISFEARLALRSFTQYSDIPLLPGKFGPALICLINLLLLIFLMSFLSKFR